MRQSRVRTPTVHTFLIVVVACGGVAAHAQAGLLGEPVERRCTSERQARAIQHDSPVVHADGELKLGCSPETRQPERGGAVERGRIEVGVSPKDGPQERDVVAVRRPLEQRFLVEDDVSEEGLCPEGRLVELSVPSECRIREIRSPREHD